jgi:hypothetical protein
VSFSTLGGVPCTRMRGQSPAWGRFWADVELAEAETLTGAQSLVVADMTQAVTVVSGGVVDGVARYRCVAGAGGWGKALPKRPPYNNDAGIRASTIIRDAAADCGEKVGTLPTTIFGPHYARIAGEAASSVLNFAAPNAWYIDLAGVTQFGARPSVTYTGAGTRTRTDLAVGVVELAVDEIENLVPGVSVDGHPNAVDVEYELTPDRLVVRLYFARQLDRRLAAFKAIFDALYPRLRYLGTWDYRVVTQNGKRLNLQPARVSTGMPDLSNVPVRPGVSGFRSEVALGELVLVTFSDGGDPTRPNVFAHDHADSPSWFPTLVEFGDGADFLVPKAALDTLQQAHDTHSHPYFFGPTPPPATPVGPIPVCEHLKGK